MTTSEKVEKRPILNKECSRTDCPIGKTLTRKEAKNCFLNFEEGCGAKLGIDVELLKAMCTHRDSRDNCLIGNTSCLVEQLEDFLPCLKIKYAYFPSQVIEVARTTCLAKQKLISEKRKI